MNRGMIFDPPEGRCHSDWRPGSEMRCAHLPESHSLITGRCLAAACGCDQFTSERRDEQTRRRRRWAQISRDQQDISERVTAVERDLSQTHNPASRPHGRSE